MSAATVKSAPCSPERVLVLFGSPHAEGPTARLTAAALASLPHGTHTLIWNCFETPVLPCDDCGYCRHQAGCSKRDLDGFYAELEEADLLLFAPEKIRERGTYLTPKACASGFDEVFVLGERVIENGEYRGGSNGEMLGLRMEY